MIVIFNIHFLLIFDTNKNDRYLCQFCSVLVFWMCGVDCSFLFLFEILVCCFSSTYSFLGILFSHFIHICSYKLKRAYNTGLIPQFENKFALKLFFTYSIQICNKNVTTFSASRDKWGEQFRHLIEFSVSWKCLPFIKTNLTFCFKK